MIIFELVRVHSRIYVSNKLLQLASDIQLPFSEINNCVLRYKDRYYVQEKQRCPLGNLHIIEYTKRYVPNSFSSCGIVVCCQIPGVNVMAS